MKYLVNLAEKKALSIIPADGIYRNLDSLNGLTTGPGLRLSTLNKLVETTDTVFRNQIIGKDRYTPSRDNYYMRLK